MLDRPVLMPVIFQSSRLPGFRVPQPTILVVN
jgi:hypothetical protein